MSGRTENWLRLSAGAGMKGSRLYDWAAGQFGLPGDTGLMKWLCFAAA